MKVPILETNRLHLRPFTEDLLTALSSTSGLQVISDETDRKLRDAIEEHKKLFRTSAAEEPVAEAVG